MFENNTILADRCMDVLSDHVGTVEAEAFIYFVRSESFDYTKWQREHFDALTPEQIQKAVEEHGQKHPFEGKKTVVL